MKSIEGVKIGQVIEPGNASKRYEITIQPEDYQSQLKLYKHSTDAIPSPEAYETQQIQNLPSATFSNSILGQHAGIVTRDVPMSQEGLAPTVAKMEMCEKETYTHNLFVQTHSNSASTDEFLDERAATVLLSQNDHGLPSLTQILQPQYTTDAKYNKNKMMQISPQRTRVAKVAPGVTRSPINVEGE